MDESHGNFDALPHVGGVGSYRLDGLVLLERGARFGYGFSMSERGSLRRVWGLGSRKVIVFVAFIAAACGSSSGDALYRAASIIEPGTGGTTATGGTSTTGGTLATGGDATSTGSATGGTIESAGGSLSTGTGGTTSMDESGGADAGLSASATPGIVSFGNKPCVLDASPAVHDVCCIGSPFVPSLCVAAPSSGCQSAFSPTTIACDDAADCPDGKRCCGAADGSSCKTSCPELTLCRTSAECPGKRCLPFAALPEYSTCQ